MLTLNTKDVGTFPTRRKHKLPQPPHMTTLSSKQQKIKHVSNKFLLFYVIRLSDQVKFKDGRSIQEEEVSLRGHSPQEGMENQEENQMHGSG